MCLWRSKGVGDELPRQCSRPRFLQPCHGAGWRRVRGEDAVDVISFQRATASPHSETFPRTTLFHDHWAGCGETGRSATLSCFHANPRRPTARLLSASPVPQAQKQSLKVVGSLHTGSATDSDNVSAHQHSKSGHDGAQRDYANNCRGNPVIVGMRHAPHSLCVIDQNSGPNQGFW
jgi:hypothetical protein